MKRWNRGASSEHTAQLEASLATRRKLMSVAVLNDFPSIEAAAALPHRPASTGSPIAGQLAPNLVQAPSSEAAANAVRYRLGVTDLFVEKAQLHLEERAEEYNTLGKAMYAAAVGVFAAGAACAVWRMFEQPIALAHDTPPHLIWRDLSLRFVVGFTAYGFVVITAVALARGARACLDQRERLLARRHALRQGRLFVHLTGGLATMDEMHQAFDWNTSQTNAFTHLPTDAKAPLGAALESIVKIAPDLVRAGANAKSVAEGGGAKQ